VATLIQRADEREERTGRGVNKTIIRNMADNLTSIVPDLWSGGWLDDLTIVDTSDPLNPRIILRLSLAEDLEFDTDETALAVYFGRNKWWTVAPRNSKW
jgi:phosphoribulokinase